MIKVNSYNRNSFGSAGAIVEPLPCLTTPPSFNDAAKYSRYFGDLRAHRKAMLVE